MKKTTLIVCAAAISILLLLFLTCPDKIAHKDAIKHVVLNYTLGDDNTGLGGALGSMFVGTAADIYLESNLIYHNYLIFSTCELPATESDKTVSYGVCNKIFTFDEDDIGNAISNAK
ncbi:MAG: hypothetical protein IJU35_03500 [Paludibacteraceae bacterium]|nr:hypothetical protein [Paludibacteraceae bacterium]